MTDLFNPPIEGRQKWRLKAKCVGMNPSFFFPERGETVRSAKAVCRACEVRRECLDYALKHGERHGIWGGLSELERRNLRRLKQLRTCLTCGFVFLPQTKGQLYCMTECAQEAVRAV